MTDKEMNFILECYKSDALRYKDGSILMDSNAMIAIAEFIEQQKAEIERLQEEVKEHIKKGVAKRKYDRALIEKEAVKEFAEDVKMAFYYQFDELIPSIMADKIDDLVKEMVGDNDDKQN